MAQIRRTLVVGVSALAGAGAHATRGGGACNHGQDEGRAQPHAERSFSRWISDLETPLPMAQAPRNLAAGRGTVEELPCLALLVAVVEVRGRGPPTRVSISDPQAPRRRYA